MTFQIKKILSLNKQTIKFNQQKLMKYDNLIGCLQKLYLLNLLFLYLHTNIFVN